MRIHSVQGKSQIIPTKHIYNDHTKIIKKNTNNTLLSIQTIELVT